MSRHASTYYLVSKNKLTHICIVSIENKLTHIYIVSIEEEKNDDNPSTHPSGKVQYTILEQEEL
jgi:hypothetical protein